MASSNGKLKVKIYDPHTKKYDNPNINNTIYLTHVSVTEESPALPKLDTCDDHEYHQSRGEELPEAVWYGWKPWGVYGLCNECRDRLFPND